MRLVKRLWSKMDAPQQALAFHVYFATLARQYAKANDVVGARHYAKQSRSAFEWYNDALIKLEVG